MTTIEKLTEIFKEFPGIGERQAKRFVYFLMAKNESYAKNLSLLIDDLKNEVSRCRSCFRFYIKNQNEHLEAGLCKTCSNANTDSSTLLIVEKDSDLESIEKSRVYEGKYFVIGGLVPIVEENTHRKVRIPELLNRIKTDENIKEIILAFSLNPEGNHTDFYVREQIAKIVEEKGVKVSSLGRGLSTGTELEYSDNETLKNALNNRQ